MKHKLEYQRRHEEGEGEQSFLRELLGEFAAHIIGFVVVGIAAVLVWLLFYLLQAGA